MLTTLEILSLDENLLAGTIPSELFLMTSLQRLELFQNAITGTIPTEVGQLSDSLSLFSANVNFLTGTVPLEHFIKLSDTLVALGLGDNNFEMGSSTIPTEIGLLSKLTSLHLGGAGFMSTIPNEFGNCTSMRRLILHDNFHLTGTIPTTIARMTDLELLTLWSNELTGTVPTEFGTLTSLTRLGMAGSNITGNVNPIFCESTIISSTIQFLEFDCLGPLPEIICSCCTGCF